jgi:hypothetical protein
LTKKKTRGRSNRNIERLETTNLHFEIAEVAEVAEAEVGRKSMWLRAYCRAHTVHCNFLSFLTRQHIHFSLPVMH